MKSLHESDVETTTLNWFKGLGYSVLHGLDIAPGGDGQKRETYGDEVLKLFEIDQGKDYAAEKG